MAARGVYKPFKPLTLKAPAKPIIESQEVVVPDSPRPAKRRRLLIHDNNDGPSEPIVTISSAVAAPRKPLLPVKNPVAFAQATAPTEYSPEGYYTVLWLVSFALLKVRCY